MNQTTLDRVLEAVKTAIITELRGYEIYRAAAERAQDPDARAMFESLARDESMHKQFLERNYDGLLREGRWTVPASPESLTPLDDTEVITPAFLQRVKGGSFEMAVIATGVELERSAIDYYRRQATTCPDETARATFEFLADWEKGHLEALVELESRMRDEYFAQRGFSRM